jgi:hypothetical protein
MGRQPPDINLAFVAAKKNRHRTVFSRRCPHLWPSYAAGRQRAKANHKHLRFDRHGIRDPEN